MAKDPQDITPAELAVLRELWSRPAPATIRDLTDRLYPAGTTSHYATVQKLLERLEDKCHVARDASAIPHRFTARLNQSDLLTRRLKDVADQLCDGSLTPLLSHLVQSQPLSKSQIAELRSLIDRLDRPQKKK